MATNEIDNRSNWNFSEQASFGTGKISKNDLRTSWAKYLFDRTLRIFDYEGLPKSIPQRDVELILQSRGNVTIAKDTKGDLYALRGGLGGEMTPYYFPVNSIVNNPWLKLNKIFTIDKDCIVIKNDSTLTGLTPLIDKYSLLLAEAELSLRLAIVNARAPHVFTADNDQTKNDMNEFIKNIEEGERLGVVGGNAFFEGLKSYDYNSLAQNQTIKQITEVIQYLKSSFFLEIGLQSNYNMKREAINESEAGMNESALIPLIDDMLNERKIGWDKVNKMFGTNVKVRLSPLWEATKKEAMNEKQPETEKSTEEIKETSQDENI